MAASKEVTMKNLFYIIIEISKWIPVAMLIVSFGLVAWLLTIVTLKYGKAKPNAKLTYLQCEGYTSTGKGKWRRVA